MSVVSTSHKGASWLLEETEPSSTFTPEKLSEEHRLMAQTVDEFVESEVLLEPRSEPIERVGAQCVETVVAIGAEREVRDA